MAYLGNPDNWVVVASTIAIVALCVVLHYEVLSLCNRYLPVLSVRDRDRAVRTSGGRCCAR